MNKSPQAQLPDLEIPPNVATPDPMPQPEGDSESYWWVEALGPNEYPERNTFLTEDRFVLAALHRNYHSFKRNLDNDRTTGDTDYYLSPTRILVGLLKSRSEFANLNPSQAVQRFERILSMIFPREEDPWLYTLDGDELLIPDKDFFGKEIDPREDFMFNWAEWDTSKPTLTLQCASLDSAQELAEQYPVRYEGYQTIRDQPYFSVVSLCYWLARLQRNLNDSPWFFLSTRDAGNFSGQSHATAGKLLKRAQRDGLIRLRDTTGRRARDAQEFVFDFSKILFHS